MHGLTPEEAKEHMVRRWRHDRDDDPIAQAISEFRARAEHHRRHHQKGAAQAYTEMAALIEIALHLCGSQHFRATQAAMMSGQAPKEIRNGAAKGSISVASLPISTAAGPLHSVRACQLLRQYDRPVPGASNRNHPSDKPQP